MPFPIRLAFVLAVVAEIVVVVLLVNLIGGWATFFLMIATAVIGGWVIRNEGLRAWTAVRDAVQSGQNQPPALGSSQAAIAGGFLLVVPGFITDLIGALLVFPVTRPWARRVFGRALRPGSRPSRPSGQVIPGEVIDGDDARREPEPPSSPRIIEGKIIDPNDPNAP